jgi:hypothetical protein
MAFMNRLVYSIAFFLLFIVFMMWTVRFQSSAIDCCFKRFRMLFYHFKVLKFQSQTYYGFRTQENNRSYYFFLRKC